MGFVANGRYILTPADPTDSEKYVNLQITCLGQAYRDITDPGFPDRHRANKPELLLEYQENISTPGVRAFLAYAVPNWTPDTNQSCSISPDIDWDAPVGLGLSRPGPLPWEAHMPLPPVPTGTRELTQLYTLENTHGTGLGQALYDALIYPDEPAYLWVIRGNHRGIRFYQKNGFTLEGSYHPCGGAWAPDPTTLPTLPPEKIAHTGRMFKGKIL